VRFHCRIQLIESLCQSGSNIGESHILRQVVAIDVSISLSVKVRISSSTTPEVIIYQAADSLDRMLGLKN
jgi:hypothetical protein